MNGQPRINNQLKVLETTLKEVEESKKYDDDTVEELDKEDIEDVERTEDEQEDIPKKYNGERRRTEEERERRDTGEEWERKEIEEEQERRETKEERERSERRETEEKKARDRKTKEDIFTTVSVQTIAQEKERIRRESEVTLFKRNDRDCGFYLQILLITFLLLLHSLRPKFLSFERRMTES